MIIKKIILENIRSYEHEEVDFSEGSTLLCGDIGSGKTSVLLAIEFALFGLQPGQRGSSLLRNGKDSGGTTLIFEVDGREVIIERTLKRGKAISQDYSAITLDNQKQELAVTELKEKVLELLNYPKEFSKKQNILYRFTVYTPQEEMKQIILEDSDTRLNTLRHVFGVDKYKKILENISIITLNLREEKKIKQALTANLEIDLDKVLIKERELEITKENLISFEKLLVLKTKNLLDKETELEEVSKKIEEKLKFQQEIEKTTLMISTKRESFNFNIRTIQQLKNEIQEGQIEIDELLISNLENEIQLKKKQKQEIVQNNFEITSKINSLSLKNQENENIKSKISVIELCPTCLQDVNPVHKSNVLNKLESDTVENVKRMQDLILRKRELSRLESNIEYEVMQIEKKVQELKILKVKQIGINEKVLRVKDLEKQQTSLEKDIELLTQHISTLKSSIFELGKYENIYDTKQRELDLVLREERDAEIKVAESKKEIELVSKEIFQIKESIKNTEKIKEQLNYISELESWLSKKFIPIISDIEKNVMLKLKLEFSKVFSEWFNMLVSESFNVRLSDDFSPIIEQQDYEIDYEYLSGGERTAVALAYRLALNQIINSLMSKIKTRNLVILDEPTDGFSEQQLDKMRDVLQELNVKQLIIVSHEQKIEGFVENVIRLKKEKSKSKKEDIFDF